MRALPLLAVASLLAALLVLPATAHDQTIPFEARSTVWVPSTPITAEPGHNLAFVIQNQDAFEHSFVVSGHGVDTPLPANADRNVTFTAGAVGTYYIFCGVPGHATDSNGDGVKDSGMAVRLQVGSTPPPTPGPEPLLLMVALLGLVAALRVYRRRK